MVQNRTLPVAAGDELFPDAARLDRRDGDRAPTLMVNSPSKPASVPSVLWLPFALTTGLLLLSLLDRVQSNAVLTRSFWGAAAVLLVWQAALLLRVKRRACGGRSSCCAAAAALRPGDVSPVGLRLLGLVLAAGLRLRLAAGRAAGVRVRLRHAAVVVAPRQLRARLRPVSDRLQHQPVPVVQGRLVLPAVPAGGGRLPRQGVRALASGGQEASTSSTPRRSRWDCSRSC